jgi:hypothetical protein
MVGTHLRANKRGRFFKGLQEVIIEVSYASENILKKDGKKLGSFRSIAYIYRVRGNEFK